MSFLPWQENQWRQLQQALSAGRLPHALLLAGDEGLGKEAFALAFSQFLLRGRPLPHAACGECRSCRFFRAGNHPDFLKLEPEAPGKPIRIDAVREMARWSVLTSQEGERRVTVICPADGMNAAAANSLLKTLEEPVRGNHVLLVSSRAAVLPATVRSRCQKVIFSPPTGPAVQHWLAEQAGDAPWDLLLRVARGAPMTALSLARDGALEIRAKRFDEFRRLWKTSRDPLSVAAAWAETDTGQTLGWLASWLRDMVRLRFRTKVEGLENPDLAEALQVMGEQFDLRDLLELQDRVQSGVTDWKRTNLNIRLQTEDLLIALLENR